MPVRRWPCPRIGGEFSRHWHGVGKRGLRESVFVSRRFWSMGPSLAYNLNFCTASQIPVSSIGKLYSGIWRISSEKIFNGSLFRARTSQKIAGKLPVFSRLSPSFYSTCWAILMGPGHWFVNRHKQNNEYLFLWPQQLTCANIYLFCRIYGQEREKIPSRDGGFFFFFFLRAVKNWRVNWFTDERECKSGMPYGVSDPEEECSFGHYFGFLQLGGIPLLNFASHFGWRISC